MLLTKRFAMRVEMLPVSQYLDPLNEWTPGSLEFHTHVVQNILVTKNYTTLMSLKTGHIKHLKTAKLLSHQLWS